MADPALPDIRGVLRSPQQGYCKQYDAVLKHLSNKDITDAQLSYYLDGMKDCISELGKQRELLVGLLLKVKWTNRSSKTIRLYQSLVLNLLSAHTFYVRAGLRMITKQFMPEMHSKHGAVSDEQKSQDDKAFVHLQTLLQSVLKIIPMSPEVLLPLLSESYPFYSKPSYVQKCYMKNILQISLYLPKYRPQILELIIDKITKIDVRCPREEISAIHEEQEDIDIFEMDEETTDDVEKMSNSTGELVESLDVLMDGMFVYIKNTCYVNGELDWEATKKLYRELLLIFDKILLPTHASNHVQYIMFFICSFREPLCDGFLTYLWNKVKDPNTQPIFRQAAVAYIQSFLARALFVPIGTVKATMELMVPWIHNYIQQSDSSTNADVKKHGPFYSACQALFYIIVFRHSELFTMHKGLKFCLSLNLQTIATSRLNPLKICLPMIAEKFASIARQHQLAYCNTIMERNRRCALPEAGSQNKLLSSLTLLNPLDSFFPFDPYLLKLSKEHIHPLFREFVDLPQEEEEDDQDMEVGSVPSYVGSAGSSLQSEVMTMTGSPTTPGSYTDFCMYGSSVGFKNT